MVQKVPKQLESIFDEFGVCTVPQVAKTHRMRTDRVVKQIEAELLPALDARSPGASRPVYKITREQVLQWYQNISVKATPTAPTKSRHRRRKAVKEFF